MDFFKLKREEYRCYLNSVRKLMESKKYKKEGVAFVALEQMPEFEKSLTQVQINSANEVKPEIYQEFCDKYTEINDKFNERFREFFAKCVKDTNIKDDLEFTLSSVKEWVYAFITPTNEEYDEVVKSGENLSATENMNLFSKLLNKDDLNIQETVENSRVRSYS